MENRYSFTDIFSKKVDLDKSTQVVVSSVVIPQIQRPYAQGRTDGISTYVRNKFLDELFDCLLCEKDELFDLNFVYGIVKPNNDEYKMELLDGQQRLTTLFLLHWYIVNAELETDDEENKLVRDCLGRFVYETRTTSTVFCQELSAYYIDLKDSTPKESIRNAKWYFKSFDRDSTICAMLTMLDAIHERYINCGRSDLHTKLNNIQFYVKSLGVFNLSEELYIKMNARGLQLSPFENFKADLTNYVSNKNFDRYKELVPLYKKSSSEEKVPFHFNFSVKLDAKWVDIFWKYGSENFDAAYMSFFSRFFACKYIIASKNEVSDKDMRSDASLKLLYTNAEEQIDSNEYYGFKEFEKVLELKPEYILTLDKVLDVIYQYDYQSDDKFIFKGFVPEWDKNDSLSGDDFYCNTSAKMSHVKLIALASVIEFIEAVPSFDSETFKAWMRTVWNIIENTNIDSLTPVSSLVRKLSSIIHFVSVKMNNGNSFYKSLSEWRLDNPSERENRAVLEEVEKARRIADDDSWEAVWREVEKHPYFKGMVTFFYDKDMSIGQYRHAANLAKDMFDENGISEAYRKEHILIRALVSHYNKWDDINELYITERAEKNKYLKNILASNNDVRAMFADVLKTDNEASVKDMLNEYIDNSPEPEPWQNADEYQRSFYKLAIDKLVHNKKIYDWIYSQDQHQTFRIYWYEGHIMFAVPRKQYAKIALDTERAKMSSSLNTDYGFEYDDESQADMIRDYSECFGNCIWMYQERGNCTIWICFDHDHEFKIHLEAKTKKYAKELVGLFEGAEIIDDDEKLVELPILEHSSKKRSYKELRSVIDDVFAKIPEE